MRPTLTGRRLMPKRDFTKEELARQAEAAAALVGFLRDVHDDDDDLIEDTIEGETEFKEAIDKALEDIAEAEMMEAALKFRIAQMNKRKKRFETKAKTLRGCLEMALAIANGDGDLNERPFTLTTPAATVTLKLGNVQVIIEDEAALPARFWRTPDPVVDKNALNEYCLNPPSADDAVIEEDEPAEEWQLPDGVRLSDRPYALMIRRQ